MLGVWNCESIIWYIFIYFCFIIHSCCANRIIFDYIVNGTIPYCSHRNKTAPFYTQHVLDGCGEWLLTSDEWKVCTCRMWSPTTSRWRGENLIGVAACIDTPCTAVSQWLRWTNPGCNMLFCILLDSTSYPWFDKNAVYNKFTDYPGAQHS